jgi:catechol-2,3-dioxygenase
MVRDCPRRPIQLRAGRRARRHLFFYQAEEPRSYSRRETGLHHDAFLVSSRAVVREAHRWACARDAVILDEPGEFTQYCFATYWLDPHWFKLEAVCHTAEES